MEAGASAIDREFAVKYVPVVYKAALDSIGEAEAAKAVVKRVFAIVQRAARDGSLPEENALDSWLTALVQAELGSTGKGAYSVESTPVIDAPQEDLEQCNDTNDQCDEVIEPDDDANDQCGETLEPDDNAPEPGDDAIEPGDDAIEQYDETREPGDEAIEQYDEIPSKHKWSALRIICLVGLCILLVVNLWFIVGLLGTMGILPKIDLGYLWFDDAFIQLFNI